MAVIIFCCLLLTAVGIIRYQQERDEQVLADRYRELAAEMAADVRLTTSPPQRIPAIGGSWTSTPPMITLGAVSAGGILSWPAADSVPTSGGFVTGTIWIGGTVNDPHCFDSRFGVVAGCPMGFR
jgi:hypothetical protein